MAELTPPASQSNTPLRSNTSEAISSPSKGVQNLTADQPIGRPITPDEPGVSPSAARIEEDETESDSDEEAELEDESQMDGVEAPDTGEAQGSMARGPSGAGGESKKRTRGAAAKGGKRVVKGKGKSMGETTKKSGPTPKKQVGKEGELYESDVVARWKTEFGDVCADRPIKA